MDGKRIFGAVTALVAAISFSLSGCSNATETQSMTDETVQDNTQDANESEETTESADKIIIFQSKVEISDQLEALAKEYEEETGVEVEVWSTTGDDYFQQLKTKLANNQGPTIFSVVPGSESEQLSAYLTDLSELSFVDSIYEGMADTIDGKTVGIPYTMEGFGLVYNKDLIDPAQVTDYDSFVAMLQEQKENGINGVGLSQESYFLIGHMLNTPFAMQDDPDAFMEQLTNGEVTMAETEEFQDFAKFYDAIRENSYNPLEVNYDKEIGDFATGKTAAIHQGNWISSMFADYEVSFEMGLMPVPIGENDKVAVSVPAAWYVNSQATAEEQQAGKEFLEWLYTSDTGIHYLMDEFGFIPVVSGMINDDLDAVSQEVSAYAEAGNTLSWAMNDWPAGIVDVYLVPVAEEFFTTDMTQEELLAKLDEAWAEASK